MLNTISPGYIGTEMTKRGMVERGWGEEWVSLTPMGRVGEPVEVAQQCASASEHHALFRDVSAQFRRCLFKRGLHRRDDLVERLGQRFEDLVGVQRETAGHTFRQIAALD